MRVLAVAVAAFVALALGLSPRPVVAEPDTVQVFFSRDPESLGDFGAVFPIARDLAPGDQGLAGAALQALIDGPTPPEQAQGYFSDFGALLVGGLSACKGGDFVLSVEGGVATVYLCRATSSAGIGQDARAQAEVEATLMQFPAIQSVRVLSVDGHCLFDLSGMDLCLQP
jgi:hypothetical protein